MAEYLLSRQAEFDLLAIYEDTANKFGAYQADAYHAGLERSFSLLADFPRMGISADEVASVFSPITFFTAKNKRTFLYVRLFMLK